MLRRYVPDGPGDADATGWLTWLEAHRPRPVRLETFLYPGGAGIQQLAGRRPSYATDVEII